MKTKRASFFVSIYNFEKFMFVLFEYSFLSFSRHGGNALIQKSAKIYLGESQLLLQNARINKKPSVDKRQKTPDRKINKPENRTEPEDLIINALKGLEPKSIQELSICLSMSQMRILESVSVMELKGWVKCSQGMVQRR